MITHLGLLGQCVFSVNPQIPLPSLNLLLTCMGRGIGGLDLGLSLTILSMQINLHKCFITEVEVLSREVRERSKSVHTTSIMVVTIFQLWIIF